MRRRLALYAVLAALSCCLAGCGGALKTYPVTGKVTLRGGKPLAGAIVEFQTTLEGGQRITASGQTGADGSFALHTPELGRGAVAGTHKVIVSPPAPDPGHSAGPAPESLVDKKFQSYATTPLEFKVQPAGPFEFPIEVHGRKR